MAKCLKDKVDDNLRTIAKLRAELEGSVPCDKLLAALDAKNTNDKKLCEAKYDLFVTHIEILRANFLRFEEKLSIRSLLVTKYVRIIFPG